jgi:hypothetical protein
MGGRIRVPSVPATHVYVRRLAHPAVERLADPSGDDHRTTCFLDPTWWRAHGRFAEIDVLHVHFGFEYYNPRSSTPSVTRSNGRAWPSSTPVTTCVTRTIQPRNSTMQLWPYGCEATVLPHPHVVPQHELIAGAERSRPRHWDRFRIGIHLKSLRANMFRGELVRAALEAITSLERVRLRIDVHHDVLDPGSSNHAPELLDLLWSVAADAASPLDLHVHHFLTDDELWALIVGVDAFVLPYRFGTHSGLLEACRDLGTSVFARRFGRQPMALSSHGVGGVCNVVTTGAHNIGAIATGS